MTSVQQWAQLQGWHYLFLDDRFLDLPPAWARKRCGGNLYAITDIARLIWAQQTLAEKYDRVVWVDADMLVFDPAGLTHHVVSAPDHGFARELFLRAKGHHTEPQWGINNALMVFDRQTPVLAEYLRIALEILAGYRDNEVPRTAMGPTLLNQLDITRSLHRIEGIGLFTPAMLEPFSIGRDRLMQEYLSHCAEPLTAANLCHFMRNTLATARRPAFDRIYDVALERLMNNGLNPPKFPNRHRIAPDTEIMSCNPCAAKKK